MMKVAIGGISHETNVFSPIETPLSTWRILEGQDIIQRSNGHKTAMGGFLEIAEREGWNVIPTLYAGATPSRPTDVESYAWLKQHLLVAIEEQKPDAVLLSMHGAMMAEGTDDPEGDIVQAVRALIGQKPLLVTLDLHGNNTAEMVAGCDAIFGFDTNPHVDSYERALEAAECLAAMTKGVIKPVTAHQHVPMLPPTINMRTAEGPMVELFRMAREFESKPGMINVSVFGGFPFCDVPYAGFNVIATANGDKALAQQACDEICAHAWQIRDQFLKHVPDIQEAMNQTEQLLKDQPTKPVICADVADNPGGGGSGDTPELLREMIRRNLPKTAAALIWDPETVELAFTIGVGNTGTFRIGGKAERAYGEPIEVEAKVRTLSDGEFYATGPMSRGNTANIGRCARLQVGNVQILISSIRMACNDADIFRHLGVEPTQQHVLLVKSRGHFRASFEPLAHRIIEVDAPGAANPNLKRYPYRRIHTWPLNIEE